MSEVIRIDADAVATHKTRTEWKEIPFAASCLKHGLCINPHFIKDNGKLIYKCDIDIALGVFDDLRGLCDLYAFCLVRTCRDNFIIQSIHQVCDY